MPGLARVAGPRLLFLFVLAVAGACRTAGPGVSPPPSPARMESADRAIRQIVRDETTAWNSGDAAAYSRYFASDGIFTNIRGQAFAGYDAFLRQHDVIFRGVFRGTRVQQDIAVLQFVEPNIALVETVTAVSGMMGPPPPGMVLDARGRLRTRLLQVLVRRGEEWKIVAYHNVDIKPGVPVAEPGGDGP